MTPWRRRSGPRLSMWDWIEYTVVCAAVWIAVVRPPFPGLPDAGCGA
jgi:hypothetical protein